MSLKLFLTVFATVFVAELGDKTQLATMLFAADQDGQRWTVFAAASAALIAATAIGVLAGALLARFVSEQQLQIMAGVGFIAIGCWVLLEALRGAAAG
ncbi:MAG: TMEM165/GDT1 family protein [Pseudomonadota bacterium]